MIKSSLPLSSKPSKLCPVTGLMNQKILGTLSLFVVEDGNEAVVYYVVINILPMNYMIDVIIINNM